MVCGTGVEVGACVERMKDVAQFSVEMSRYFTTLTSVYCLIVHSHKH